jgi:hypothetical protein
MTVSTIWPAEWQVQAIAPSSDYLRREVAAKRRDALLDEALEQTFPASDPIGAMRVT